MLRNTQVLCCVIKTTKTMTKKFIIGGLVAIMVIAFGLVIHRKNKLHAEEMPSMEIYEKSEETRNMDKDIELLMADLSARLPYGVMVETALDNGKLIEINIEQMMVKVRKENGEAYYAQIVDGVKPYLRHTTSMTRHEVRIFTSDFGGEEEGEYDAIRTKRRDWLLKNHFDFRGLIERGLAIEVER